MVYSQICSWLDDYVGSDPPEELVDEWDFDEWLNESELESTFRDCFLDVLKTRLAKRDSIKIFYSLLWEYYLLRKEEALAKIKLIEQPLQMNGMVPGVINTLTDGLLDISNNTIYISSLDLAQIICGDRDTHLQKTSANNSKDIWRQVVFLTPKKGRLSAEAHAARYKPVVLEIYSLINKIYILKQWKTYKHVSLTGLTTSPDALNDCGRLVFAAVVNTIDEDVIPYNNYCALQGALQVLDGQVADYCECIIVAGSSDEGLYCGMVAVVGDAADIASWTYVYSPVYPNTKAGRRDARCWRPEQNILERQQWTCLNVHCRPLIRNNRWWSLIGLPEYSRFLGDIEAIRKSRKSPLFLDDT